MNAVRLRLPTLLLRCLSSGVRAVLVVSMSVTLVLLFALWSLASARSDL